MSILALLSLAGQALGAQQNALRTAGSGWATRFRVSRGTKQIDVDLIRIPQSIVKCC